MSNRNLTATFCDDIRHEIGGKISLIGCYAGDMIVPVFPITLPKLCLHFTLTTRLDTPFHGPITVSIFQSGNVISKVDINSGWAPAANLPARPDGTARDTLFLQGGFELSPITFDKPTTLLIVAETEGDVIQGPMLHIGTPPVPQNSEVESGEA